MPEQVIQGENIIASRHHQEEEKQSQTWDYVRVELVQEVLEQVTVGDYDEDDAECEQRRARQQAGEDEPPGGELDIRDREPKGPEQPRRDPARRIRVDEESMRVRGRSHLKELPPARHPEDES